MAAAGVPMRTLQEWLGHRDVTTTQRYADYAPGLEDAGLVERAFPPRSRQDPEVREPHSTSEHLRSEFIRHYA